MSPISVSQPKAAGLARWVLAPYGVPGETSEVRRIEGFYAAEDLTICGDAVCGAAEDAVEFDKAA